MRNNFRYLRMTTYIHLRPSLQEFVVCAFLHGGRKATAGDIFGLLIKPWLSPPPKGYNPLTPSGADVFEFELPVYEDKYTGSNFYISPAGQKHIALFLQRIFLNQMYLHLDAILPRAGNGCIKDAIFQYCEIYNIGFEHIQYESLKKSYYRYRCKRDGKK
jgi:hypothetical protein